jgi:protein gp37
VFCASLADVFDKAAPLEARQRLWTLIQATPQLEWRLLTKRPQNIARWLPPDWGQGYANVRFGVTVETQREAARRLPVLARLPMQLKPFASCEPLLEALDLTPYLPLLSQVIIGGESGAKSQARPFELDWARALIAQCREVQVAVFIKQLGRQPLDQGRPLRLRHTKGEDIREWPSALRCQEEPIDAERTDDRSG